MNSARIVMASITFALLLLVASILISITPLLAFLLFLGGFDQLDDIYQAVYGKTLVPVWLMPIDILLETVVVIVSIGILYVSLVYALYSSTMLFLILVPLSIIMIMTALDDINLDWMMLRRRA
jgi:hypothetical protein